ncbi:MAG: thiamine pyrophosphate-binding protein, partial [Acidimicrobiales bacterium]
KVTSESTEMTGGDIVVAMLRRFDVEMMFGLPGDQTHLYDALHRQHDIRHVLVRHEQAAAHMADAYARKTGKVGVCDASIGPGATNLISGISEAFMSGIPVVAIVSDVRSDWRGRDSFQEIDQVNVFKPITKKVFSVDHTDRIPEFVARAFQIATTGRPGPVLLSFPIDVLRTRRTFTPADLAVDSRYGRFPAIRMTPPAEDMLTAVDSLLAAERPIILAGGGVVASNAMPEVQELAELLDIPIATTYMGKGTVAENHPLSLGPFGLIGRAATNDYVLDADFALALGTRFTNVDTVAWRVPASATKLVQVDIEPTQIGRNYLVDQALPGDIKAVLQAMLGMIHDRGVPEASGAQQGAVSALTSQWRIEKGIESASAQDDEASPIHPLQVIRALRNVMAPDDAIICDSGFNQIWGGQYFEVRKPGRYYMGPRGFGVMGFSVPAAIAHALASPDQRVVALCGDGGFAMVIQELETALRSGADITVCIMNNSNLQYIRDNQRLLFESRFISTEFSELDYASIARAFGCAGTRVERSGDLEPALAEALANKLPTVVDVRVDGEVVPERTSLQSLT